MAKTKLEITKWLKEDMGFSDDEIKDQKLVEAFTPRVDKLSDGYMRQSDYDRVQNEAKAELKTQSDALIAAQSRLDAEVAEWATVQANGKGVTDKMRTDLDAAQAERLRLEQVLRKTATDAGLNPDDVMKGIVAAPAPKKDDAPPPIDTSKFVTREQYQLLANMALQAPAQLDRIQREHFDLTGEYLNPEELVAEVQSRAGTRGNQKSLELRDIWEEKYEIPAKREAKSKAKYDADIAAAETRGREAAYSESALPGGGVHPVGKHAPIFAAGAERKSVLQRPQPGQGSQAAVTALRSGKYRQAVPGAPPAAGQPAGKSA